MVPTVLMTPDRRFAGAIGSAGGNAILAYVAKSLVGAIDWNLPMQQAIGLPNLVARGRNFQGEVHKFPPPVLEGLRARGAELRPGQGEDSGVHGVIIRDGRVDGWVTRVADAVRIAILLLRIPDVGADVARRRNAVSVRVRMPIGPRAVVVEPAVGDQAVGHHRDLRPSCRAPGQGGGCPLLRPR